MSDSAKPYHIRVLKVLLVIMVWAKKQSHGLCLFKAGHHLTESELQL